MRRRPVFLNLFRIHFPVTAVVSIAHRVSGVLLALSLPVVIFLLHHSLAGPQDFAEVSRWLAGVPARVLLLLLGWLLAHHFFAGIRFLLIDLELGVSRSAARASAWIVHGAAAVMAAIVAWGLFR